MVACRHPLSLSLSLPSSLPISGSFSLSLSHLSSLSLSLSLARALAHALGLMNSSVLEDTGVLPSLFVSLSLGCLLFLSRAIFDPSLISRSLSLSRARALTLARRLIYICALEDTIGIPTCWNGVLQSPSVIVSSHLRLSLSVSVSVPHSSRSACGWFCQARAAQQGQTRVTLGSLAHPSVLRPHSRLCSAAPAPQAVQRCSVTRLRPPRPLRHLRILWQLPCSCYSDGLLWRFGQRTLA